MEINHYGDVIEGAVAQEDIVEGRMVCHVANTYSRDFGSQTDLPGCRVPQSAAEAARARYIVTFESDDRPLPIMQPQPSFTWALRQGWDQAQTIPFPTTVYLTHPQNQEMLIIGSGSGCALYGEGIYTVPSGCYVYTPTIETPGTQLEVSYSGGNAGKVQVYGSGGIVAEVERFSSTTKRLTFRIIS